MGQDGKQYFHTTPDREVEKNIFPHLPSLEYILDQNDSHRLLSPMWNLNEKADTLPCPQYIKRQTVYLVHSKFLNFPIFPYF